MRSFILHFATILMIFSCNTKMPPANATNSPVNEVSSATPGNNSLHIPGCLRQKIDSIKALPVWNPPAEIHEYNYNGRKMFALSAPCCDFFNTVVDENCNYVCAPSGGFTGRGDGKCTDFFKAGKHIRLVWKDERERK